MRLDELTSKLYWLNDLKNRVTHEYSMLRDNEIVRIDVNLGYSKGHSNVIVISDSKSKGYFRDILLLEYREKVRQLNTIEAEILLGNFEVLNKARL